MFIKRDAVLVVDAYSTGAFFAPAFAAHGVPAVHLRSTEAIRPNLKATARAQDFALDLLYADDEALLRGLADVRVRWVLAGCEEGVELAAHVAELLGVEQRNDAALWERWRNKHVMHEALKAAGVRSIRHLRTDRAADVHAWMQAESVEFPVVVKPIDSAGSDNVHICADPAHVERALARVLASSNALLQRNRVALVQEYLRNEELRPAAASGGAAPATAERDVEYCVNTVSCGARHHVTEIIKVFRTRVGDAPVHDYNELLCPVRDAWAYDILGGYVASVLDALAIVHGPAHSELMVVDGQPVLLETAARLPGGVDLSAYSKALGTNQLALTVQASLDPQGFLDMAAQPRRPLRTQSSCVFLISDREGEIVSGADVSGWLDLPTLHSLKLRDKGRLERTDALFNAPGQLFLLADQRAEIERDRQALRRCEPRVYESLLQA